MKLVERNNRTTKSELLVDETIFSLANGLIGVRGNFVEGYGNDRAKQTYLNGFYNTYDYKYEENSIHFPQKGERIVNIIDGQTIDVYLEGEAIHQQTSTILSLHRTFDLDLGFTTRSVHYKTQNNKEIILKEKKMVSFDQKELLLIDLEIESLNFEGKIEIRSALELPVQRIENKMDPRINIAKNPEIIIERKMIKPKHAGLYTKTSHTDLYLFVSMSHSLPFTYEESATGVEALYTTHLSPRQSLHFTKNVIYTSSTLQKELIQSNHRKLERSLQNGWDYYESKQKEILSDFWNQSFVEIDGDLETSLMLQYNIYQLNASHAGIKELNIASKGLSGEGYEGHYFWDTEIYMFPFFLLTNLDKAKALIKNRYINLEKAKIEAHKLGIDVGAKIPWRTINGTELSPYYPAGSAQYHINSDVAYTVIKYFSYTEDIKFLKEIGFELLLETGRFLYHAGNMVDNQFHINAVTGPDEYSALVNDNYYTNSMAKYHFDHIILYYQEYHKELELVIKKCQLTHSEIHDFEEASKKMVFHFDEFKQVFAQDESFLHKPELDISRIPKENFPLLLHYHPLFIYRHQVLKQADTLLSMFLLDYDNHSILKSNFDYYLKRTTHDSSLSKCIYAINALKLGETDLAYEYLLDVLQIDFLDSHHNTHHGLHIASLGGSYLAIAYGMLGFNIHQGKLSIHPVLPKNIPGFTLKCTYHSAKLTFRVTHNDIHIISTKPVHIGIYNTIHLIENEYRCDYINM